MKHIKHSRAHWLQTHYNGGEGLVTIADCISGSIQVYATKKYIMHLEPYEYKNPFCLLRMDTPEKQSFTLLQTLRFIPNAFTYVCVQSKPLKCRNLHIP